MATETYLLTGHITTQQPLAYSPPQPQGAGKGAADKGTADKKPPTPLPRMTRVRNAEPKETVFVSGSTIRGKLRHACADAYLLREHEQQRQVDYRRYLQLKVGGVKGKEKEQLVGLKERKEFLEQNPFLDLFGAGKSEIGWVHGRLDCGAALPESDKSVKPVVLRGVRRNAALDPILPDVLPEAEWEKVQKEMQQNRDRSRAKTEVKAIAKKLSSAKKRKPQNADEIKRLEQELQRWKQTEAEAKTAQAKDSGSDNPLQHPNLAYEAIPVDIKLKHRMLLKQVSPEQLAIFAAGLARFAEDPRFGAHRAHGCGQVALDYRVLRLAGTQSEQAGHILIDSERWEKGESSLELTGAPAAWLKAWEDDAGAKA